MKTIQLTKGKVALVDDEDFERLNQYKWYANGKNPFCYAVRMIKNNGSRYMELMHREIMSAPKRLHIDHKSHDTLDNRKINLRLCTTRQNAQNRKIAKKGNKTGIKGVTYNKQYNKFRAQIIFNGKFIHLGSFNVLGDADSAYRKAEEKYFGEFARAM